MNFIITGMGRSGTKSLATYLSQNKEGVPVHHEKDNTLLTTGEQAQAVSDRLKDGGPCGEVSSYFRNVASLIKADTRAVVLRHPYRILLSAVNRSPTISPEMWAPEIEKGLVCVHNLMCMGYVHIRFEDYVNKPDELSRIAKVWFNLTCEGHLPYENGTGEYKVKKIGGAPVQRLKWFAEMYYPEFAHSVADINELGGM